MTSINSHFSIATLEKPGEDPRIFASYSHTNAARVYRAFMEEVEAAGNPPNWIASLRAIESHMDMQK